MTATGFALTIAALVATFFIGGAVFTWNNRADVDAAYKEGRRDGLEDLAARMDAKREWKP